MRCDVIHTFLAMLHVTVDATTDTAEPRGLPVFIFSLSPSDIDRLRMFAELFGVSIEQQHTVFTPRILAFPPHRRHRDERPSFTLCPEIVHVSRTLLMHACGLCSREVKARVDPYTSLYNAMFPPVYDVDAREMCEKLAVVWTVMRVLCVLCMGVCVDLDCFKKDNVLDKALLYVMWCAVNRLRAFHCTVRASLSSSPGG